MLKKIYAAKNTVRTSTSKVVLELLNRSGGVRASRIVDGLVGKDLGTGKDTANSAITHNSEFYGKTRGLGSTSTTVDMAGPML